MNRTHVWVAALACLFLLAPPATADGIPAYYDNTGWHLAPERAQFAVIHHEDGRQILLLQVALGREATPATAEKLVWVTPLPARAGNVQVDVLRGFPRFYGAEPTGWLESNLRELLGLLATTQIYPAFGLVLLLSGATKSAGDLATGVRIEQEIQKDGVALQVLETPSTQALADHLDTLGVAFPQPALEALDGYTGSEASLVVFRIADLASYRSATTEGQEWVEALGVQLVFPTKEGFFPLVASSALPGDRLDVVITAVGFQRPLEPRPKGLWTEYYLGAVSGTPAALAALGVGAEQNQRLRYTRFRISARPSELTADLRFGPGAPPAVERAATWLSDPTWAVIGWVTWFLLHILLSVLASLAVRGLWPSEVRPGWLGAAALGLANLGTWLGYLIAVGVLGCRRKVRTVRIIAVGFAFSLAYLTLVGGLYGLSFAVL